MRPTPLILLTVLLCTYLSLYSQGQSPGGKVTVVRLPYYVPAPSTTSFADSNRSGADTQRHSLLLLPSTRQTGKKGFSSFALPSNGKSVSGGEKHAAGRVAPLQGALLQIHGNILYNVDYRSYIDTPYAENDVYYHTIQTYLDVTYRNSYPMRVYLTNRFGNSAFTRRLTDLNMQFNANDFKNRLRQSVKRYQIPAISTDSLLYWQQLLEHKQLEVLQLNGWLNGAAITQQLIEAEERMLYPGTPKLSSKDTLPVDLSVLRSQLAYKKNIPSYLSGIFKVKDSGQISDNQLVPDDSAFLAAYAEKKGRLDSLKQQLAVVRSRYNKYKESFAALRNHQNRNIDQAVTIHELEAERKRRNIPDSALPVGYKTLWAIRNFGIGRTMVDYSELSAKNVSINGLQVEYNPSYYVAVATGTIDYRFRDFIIKNASVPRQHLNLVRLGTGQRNANNIILTWYTGKKQLYNSTGVATASQPDFHLMGFTLEGTYQLNAATFVTAEVAKSSLPYYNRPGAGKSLLSTTLKFNDHSNEAYSLKLQSVIPATATRFTGFYKHYGANFQSFSLITTGVQQKAWMLKAEQPFFRKQLTVNASVKENDYTNPAVNMSYQSNMVFKSIQLTARLPKWPVLMVGYYPSSQLTKLADESYTENMFYSLVANMSYYYKTDGIVMNSVAMYNRFYNKPTDTAFVYYNTSNIMFIQAFFYQKLTWQTTLSAALAGDYNLYTVDNDAQYALQPWLTLGGGIKYNRQTSYNINQLGYRGSVIVKIKKLGELQLMIDKGFIPGANRQLVENKTGRFSFFKIF